MAVILTVFLRSEDMTRGWDGELDGLRLVSQTEDQC
jgi:hypothetical protein